MSVAASFDLRSKILSNEDLQNMRNVHDAKLNDLDFFKDFLIIIMNDVNMEDFRPTLKVVLNRKVQSTLLVLTEDETEQLKIILSELQSNSYFYILKINESRSCIMRFAEIPWPWLSFQPNGDYVWTQMSSFNYEPIVVENSVSFDLTGQIIKDYDFDGTHFVYTSLTWAPYLTVENCNELGRNCTYYGFLGDMMNIYAREFNFTWDIQKDLDNSWGLFPKSGPYNLSGNNLIDKIVNVFGLFEHL